MWKVQQFNFFIYRWTIIWMNCKSCRTTPCTWLVPHLSTMTTMIMWLSTHWPTARPGMFTSHCWPAWMSNTNLICTHLNFTILQCHKRELCHVLLVLIPTDRLKILQFTGFAALVFSSHWKLSFLPCNFLLQTMIYQNCFCSCSTNEWQYTEGMNIGAVMSVTAGIPLFVEVGWEISAEANFEYSYGESHTETIQVRYRTKHGSPTWHKNAICFAFVISILFSMLLNIFAFNVMQDLVGSYTNSINISECWTFCCSLEARVTVPAKHSCYVSIVARQMVADVPYDSTATIYYPDGSTESVYISGVYEGLSVSQDTVQIDECLPIEEAPNNDEGQNVFVIADVSDEWANGTQRTVFMSKYLLMCKFWQMRQALIFPQSMRHELSFWHVTKWRIIFSINFGALCSNCVVCLTTIMKIINHDVHNLLDVPPVTWG